jgi:hypothetical protein
MLHNAHRTMATPPMCSGQRRRAACGCGDRCRRDHLRSLQPTYATKISSAAINRYGQNPLEITNHRSSPRGVQSGQRSLPRRRDAYEVGQRLRRCREGSPRSVVNTYGVGCHIEPALSRFAL